MGVPKVEIWLRGYMKYFTSDTHFGHHNIIGYCGRPFDDVQKMNEAMLGNLQMTLTDSDDLYFLGDWSMSEGYYGLLKNVPFRHLYFILGNHDKGAKLIKHLGVDGLDSRVTVVKELTITIDSYEFYLVHRPVVGSDRIPTLCGHVHEKWTYMTPGVELSEYKNKGDKTIKVLKQPILNVGVDRHNFLPIPEGRVLEFFKANVLE